MIGFCRNAVDSVPAERNARQVLVRELRPLWSQLAMFGGSGAPPAVGLR